MQKKILVYISIVIFAYVFGNSLANFFIPAPMPKQYNFSGQNQSSQNGQVQAPNKQNIDNFKAISQRNLFAVNSHQAVATAPQANPTAPTEATKPAGSSSIRLVGTIDIENSNLARAIVVVDGQQKIIKLNDQAAGYTVKSIKRNEVILEANGQELKLEQKLLR